MNCLCCNKPLKSETESGWHKACIRRFFGTNTIPEIEIDDQALEALAIESTGKGFTVPGVQKKLSLHLHSEGKTPRLTLVNYPTGYILKPQVAEFKCLPEAEQLVMSMAEISGISTVPHGLIRSGDDLAYITKRIDRVKDETGVRKIAMEDFCQLDLRLTADKYKGSYERCVKVIEKYSSQVGLDISELFVRLVFSFVVGNSDMHLKNFSLMERDKGNYVLSPAYDLVPVNLVMPEDKEEFALPMNGKQMHLRKKDFLVFAESCHISKASAEKMISGVIAKQEKYVELCNHSFLPEPMKEAFINLINARCNVLKA